MEPRFRTSPLESGPLWLGQGGRRLALLVGVNGPSTPGRPRLLWAPADAHELAAVLQQETSGFQLVCPPLLQEQATSDNVREAVLRLAQELQPGDAGLFYFSGQIETLLPEADQPEYYLVTHDWETAAVQLSATSPLSLRWLRQVLLEHPRAAAVLLILDGCYSDVLSSSAPAPSFEMLRQRLASSFAGMASPARQEGIRLVLTAGGRDLAQEQAGHGVLTSTLLAALRGERAEIVDTEGQLVLSRLLGWLSEVLRQEGQVLWFFGNRADLVLGRYPQLAGQSQRGQEHPGQRALAQKKLQESEIDPDQLVTRHLEQLRRQSLEQWERVCKPILGVLLVAREPLSREQLLELLRMEPSTGAPGGEEQLEAGLQALGELLSQDERGRYSLSHDGLRQTLQRAERGAQERGIFADDEVAQWQRRLATWCTQGGLAHLWEKVPGEEGVGEKAERERRSYGLAHALRHLYEAGEWEQLFAALDASQYGRAKVQWDLSMRAYAQDLELGMQAAASPHWGVQEGIKQLPRLWRYALLRGYLGSRADRFPDAAFAALLLLGREQQALGLAELLSEPLRQVRILLRIASWLSRQPAREQEAAALLARTQQLALGLSDQWERKEALRIVAQGLEGAQQWEEATRLILFDDEKRAEALSKLTVELARSRKGEEARRSWQQAQEIINCLPTQREREEVLGMLAEELARAQRWEEARQVIAFLTDKEWRARTQSMLAEELARAQRWEEARQIIALLPDEGRRAWALINLTGELARAGRWEEMRQCWRQVQGVLTAADQGVIVQALSWLAVRLALCRRWEEARQVMAFIQHKGWREATLGRLAEELARAQRWEEARQVIASLSDAGQRARALSTLAGELARVQRWEEASRCWQQAQEIIASLPDEEKRVEALSMLAGELARAQHWEEARQVIATISDREERIMALCGLAHELARAHEEARLLRLVQQAWLQVTTCRLAFRLLPLALGLLPRHPELGPALAEGIGWVEACWQEVTR